MAGRIVLLGATGYTGTLTAHSMVAKGLRPILAGRNAEALGALQADLVAATKPGRGRRRRDIEPLETAFADVSDQDSVSALVDEGDVLVTTVGPFAHLGTAALEAAITRGAHYIDSTGEPSFLREVFEEWSPRAEAAGIALLPAFGYDYVPGNLVGAMALERAKETGTKVTRLDVLYAVRGSLKTSGGTAASAAGMVVERGMAFRGGRLVEERPGVRTWAARHDDHSWQGLSVGATEHWTMPRLNADLLDISVYLGWAAGRTEQAAKAAAVADAVSRLPGAKSTWNFIARRVVPGSTGGPDATERAKARTLAIAEARTLRGQVVSHVAVEGPSPYDLTAEILTWAAQEVIAGKLRDTGALGIVDAFGYEEAVKGCAELGLAEVSD
jgi:short subunit dehydrogenase-like uncharacterized protein